MRTSNNLLAGIKNKYTASNLKDYKKTLLQINTYHKKIKELENTHLKVLGEKIKLKVKKGNPSLEIITQLYALIKEICIRQLKITPYDMQIVGALALAEGKVVEMQTGEGKTLSAVFAACYQAFKIPNVFIITFNDYLAKRDMCNMQKIYNFFGLSASCILGNTCFTERKEKYKSNIIYSTVKEFGFDYLKSNLAYNKSEKFIPEQHFAIVDEADAILIDEAKNPLVLAGSMLKENIDFYKIADFVALLVPESHFNTDEYKRNVYLTEEGINKAEQEFGLGNLYADKNLQLHSAINLALQAKILLSKNKDYIIKKGEIKLVDELTGRIIEDRKWRNGLQIAVEAKEKLELQAEGKIINSITIQHLLEKFNKVSAMTATARQSSEEFLNFYGMETVIIPPVKKNKRIDLDDVIFETKKEKIKAIVDEIKKVHHKGQPVLIGTLTIKESEQIASYLAGKGIKCNILNAKNDEKEAEIIASAGKLGAVTVSTNMAGRGTDILLGGVNGEHKEKIIQLGGLYIIATNKHESSRIDYQLRGRAGRQGDPGITKFFLSYEDELMIKYNLKNVLPVKLKMKKAGYYLNHIQKVIEGQLYDIRKMLYDYSSLIEKQRCIINTVRNSFLEKKTTAMELLLGTVDNQLKDRLDSKYLREARNLILSVYDKHWAEHLDYLYELKEGIHLLRIGRQNPLREFQKYADNYFQTMLFSVKKEIKEKLELLLSNKESMTIVNTFYKPGSTWTYIANDSPFGNRFSIGSITGSQYLGF